MKKAVLLFAYLISLNVAASANPLDSLRQQLQITTDNTVKANIYTQLANCYLDALTIADPYTKRVNQENAINYTMMGMRIYYKQDDTTGLKMSYSNLAKAYRSQKKYAQAKWFILQANTLARRQNNVPDVIGSLIELAAIKMDIKDYQLAKKDLKEAHRLAKANGLTDQDSTVKLSYTRLYTYIQVPASENVYQGLDESIAQEEKAYAERQKKLMIAAALKAKSKKVVTFKKKPYMASIKRTNVSKRNMLPVVMNWDIPVSNTAVSDTVRTTVSL
jgi:tetratricopeptide (TPR) repeat protein